MLIAATLVAARGSSRWRAEFDDATRFSQSALRVCTSPDGYRPALGPAAQEMSGFAAGRNGAARRRSPLAHADGRDRPPDRTAARRRRSGHDRHALSQGFETQAAAARQQQSALQGHVRRRYRAHRSRFFPRRAQIHRKAAARRRIALRLGPHRTLRRSVADGASRLHCFAGSPRRTTDAGAGLSADGGPLRQGLDQGGAPSRRARPGSSRMAGKQLAGGARLARFQGRAEAHPSTGRSPGRFERRRAVAAARLR